MKRLLMAAAAFGLAAGIVPAGCKIGSEDASEPFGLLRKVADAGELEASIKAGFTTLHPSVTSDTTALVAADSTTVGNYSRTYVQEVGVDESDSVKYDGEYLFLAPVRQQVPCCFITDLASTTVPAGEAAIRIFETDPAAAGAAPVGTIPLAEGVSVQGLYRTGDRLVALTSEALYGTYGAAWSSLAIWAPETAGLAVYDTTDIAEPAVVFEADFEGVFVSSRRIGDVVYVISRFTPAVENVVYGVATAADQAANQAALADVSLAELLPAITVNGESRSLVTPEDCFVPSDEPPAYPGITSITAFPIDDPAAFTTVCYNDDAYGVYVSPTAIYIAQSKSEGQDTRLHKFALDGGGPDYAGSADIEGIVWTGGQGDFRLHEKDGHLRALSTRYDPVASDFLDHRLYVLRESPTAPALEIVARLPNDDRPEEIGKPNEQLYGVRFLDDRAFAVTFRLIDPLYVLDLSDPADPRIAGTLEVPGFSEFLHPVGEDLLLGLGFSDTNAVKLELFDVSDLSRPLSIASDVLGGNGSVSEAIYDRHAFTYLADVGGVDRFTIPADLVVPGDSVPLFESGLYMYEVRDKDMPALASLQRVGAAVVRKGSPDGWPDYSMRNRAVLHDDAVYYVRDNELYSLFWGTSEIVSGPN